MENQGRVQCLENQELATYLFNKWKEMAEQPKGISENIEKTLSKAYHNVCNYKSHIQTMKDLSQVKYACISPHFVGFALKFYIDFGLFPLFCSNLLFFDFSGSWKLKPHSRNGCCFSADWSFSLTGWKRNKEEWSYILFKYDYLPSWWDSFAFLKLCTRGVGKWILKLMLGFFGTASGGSEAEDLTNKGMSLCCVICLVWLALLYWVIIHSFV